MVARVSPVSTRSINSLYAFSPVTGTTRSSQTRQGTTTETRPQAALDEYVGVTTPATNILAAGTSRALTPTLFRRTAQSNDSLLEVSYGSNRVKVEVHDANPVSIPSEERTKEVISEIMPSVVSLHMMGTEINPETKKEEPAEWIGSGFSIDPEELGLGADELEPTEVLIATNNHVADGATTMDIELFDGTVIQRPVNVLVQDEDLDFAILVVDIGKLDLPPVPIGAKNSTEQGDFVLTFGSPYGLPFRVTRGIVSNRFFDEDMAIQTDAAINPGNSGGPLVDLGTGEVVGMDTYVIQGAENMGFAMPIWMQLERARELLAEDDFRQPVAGWSPDEEVSYSLR